MTVGSVDDFVNYLNMNPNTTAYSVVWCTDQWDVSKEYNISLPCKFGEEFTKKEEDLIFYSLWYNQSMQEPFLFKPTNAPVPKNKELIILQETIDNAILEHLH